MRRMAGGAGTALDSGLNDLLLDRGRSAVSDQDLLYGPDLNDPYSKLSMGCH